MDMHENGHPELGRISASLYIAESTGRGRGVFCNSDIRKGSIIEVSPVIVMSAGDRSLLDQTLLHDYIFLWGKNEEQCCIALGYLSVYNHSYNSNAEYEMDYALQSISVKAVRNIRSGEEIFINYNGVWNNAKPVWFDQDGRFK